MLNSINMKKELFNLRFQHVTGQLENPVKLRETKRDIARVKDCNQRKRACKGSGLTERRMYYGS